MFSSLNSPPKLNLQKQLTSKDCIPKPASLSSHYCLFQFETNTVSLIPLITLVCKGAMFVCYLIKWLVFCPPHHMGVYMFSECKCYQQCIKSTAFWCETRSIICYQLEFGKQLAHVLTEWSSHHWLNAPFTLMTTAAFSWMSASYFSSSSW